MKERLKKINFKDKKYILPLISLPFALLIASQLGGFIFKKEEKKQVIELQTTLGETGDSILNKDDAYDMNYLRDDQGRTMLDGIDSEQDSLNQYADNLDAKQKRMIDSLKSLQPVAKIGGADNKSYYNPNSDDKEYQRSMDMIRMLNSNSSPSGSQATRYGSNSPGYGDSYDREASREKQEDPLSIMKKQMLVMDSIEKSKDPEYQAQLRAEEQIKRNKEKLKKYLANSYNVRKDNLDPSFNSVTLNNEPNYIKAVIDENRKVYLGSRIRFRLLDNVTIAGRPLKKGTILYGMVSGFTLQRVNLSIVSALVQGEITPINLAVYDLDGMKGLYVPASIFREMVRELGTNSVQGQQLSSGNETFFASMGSKLFQSASTTVSNIIQKNKVNLKYNSFIYLINESNLQRTNDN